MTNLQNTQRKTRESIRLWCVISFILLLLLGVFFAGRWMWQAAQNPNAFPIQTIQIRGQLSHVPAFDIQKMIQANLTGNFFTLQTSQAREKMLALPWIVSVSFRRIWPNTLRVHIAEQTPVARWEDRGLMNASGQIFYPDINTIPNNLPIFFGPIDQTKTMLAFYHAVTELLKPLNLSVVRVNLSNRQSWSMQLDNQISMTLGREEALKRLKRFIAIYPTFMQTARQPILSVDLRYPNGLAAQ